MCLILSPRLNLGFIQFFPNSINVDEGDEFALLVIKKAPVTGLEPVFATPVTIKRLEGALGYTGIYSNLTFFKLYVKFEKGAYDLSLLSCGFQRIFW